MYLYLVPITALNDHVHFYRLIIILCPLDLISTELLEPCDQQGRICNFLWPNPRLKCGHPLNRQWHRHSFVKLIATQYCKTVSIFWTMFHFASHKQRWNSVLVRLFDVCLHSNFILSHIAGEKKNIEWKWNDRFLFILAWQVCWRKWIICENDYTHSTFNSLVTTQTYDPSWVIALSDVMKSWCGIRRSYNNFRCDRCQTSNGNGFCVSSPQTRILEMRCYFNL